MAAAAAARARARAPAAGERERQERHRRGDEPMAVLDEHAALHLREHLPKQSGQSGHASDERVLCTRPPMRISR